MNGNEREIWDQIGWLKEKAIRAEEKMNASDAVMLEIRELLKSINENMMTRQACSEKHGQLHSLLDAHLDRTEGRAARLKERLIGWALIAAVLTKSGASTFRSLTAAGTGNTSILRR